MGEKKQMKKVVFFNDISKISTAMNQFDLDSFTKQKILVKLHMGEVKNKYFLKPSFVKQIIDVLHDISSQPFLYDTTVLYKSPRRFKKGYQQVAKLHGFTKENVGCSVHIDEAGEKVHVDEYEYEVGSTLHQSTHIVAISHVKGHNAIGMGGAIKNFGMGGVTRNTKKEMHDACRPVYSEKNCTRCGRCETLCPFNAIKIKDDSWIYNQRCCFGCGVCVENCPEQALCYKESDLQYRLACSAKACVQHKNVIYVNEIKRISKGCDCDPNSGPIICPDIGYVVSDDPVAIDAASLDLIDKEKRNLFINENHVDPRKQIKFGEKIGLGTTKYELINL